MSVTWEAAAGGAWTLAAEPAFGWATRFRPGSLTHLIVVLAIVGGAALLVQVGRALAGTPRHAALVRSLRAAWAIVWLLWQLHNFRPARFSIYNSLPLHVCSIVGLTLLVTLGTRWRRARGAACLGSLALCTQALFTPTLTDGPAFPWFWLFFLSHGMIVALAVFEIAANGVLLNWQDWRAAALACLAYLAIIFPLDVAFHLNYGFVGQPRPGPWVLADALGPWPGRVAVMYLLALAVMAAIVFPFELARWMRARPALTGSVATTFTPPRLAA